MLHLYAGDDKKGMTIRGEVKSGAHDCIVFDVQALGRVSKISRLLVPWMMERAVATMTSCIEAAYDGSRRIRSSWFSPKKA